eukprot:TRINITY_DN2187_c0_g3_i12.p1 TRINITY_DN2187_c0_g3~~TRINITY_DN2187_c0_g3_i12.p1  ORF type:complete len:367 (-),score=55.04 TRINITY_DN2187_c0_g3_i12:704-1804(-)
MSQKGLKEITVEELAQHSKEGDAWIAVEGFVYNVSTFALLHPGGKGVLLRYAGKECTEEFNQNHGDLVLKKYHDKLVVGKLREIPKKLNKLEKIASKGPLPLPDTIFGDLVPFGDPTWYQGWASPYYKDGHKRFRQLLRDFTEREVTPNVHRWDEGKSLAKEFLVKCADTGLLALSLGLPWPIKYFSPPEGIKVEELDSFYELIFLDELSRCASGGVLWGLSGGLAIGLPPVLKFGSEEMKQKVAPSCLQGKKVICLAITEPWGGSDVANLKTTAVKTPDGKNYVVNGEKKWITNGVYADYFTVAVRTGGPGMKGVSLLLIERGPGITTKQMSCMGVWASGTSYITFEDVVVPVENLIGKENKGFR